MPLAVREFRAVGYRSLKSIAYPMSGLDVFVGANGVGKTNLFYKDNAGKFLMPSHRIGMEPNRPAITIYRVRDDGSDTLGSVIGPAEMKGHTWESLAQLVGERILWDSLEGIELMRALQPDREPDPEDHPTNARSST